ncbi:hypothetical protein B7494_g4363 [Chlorociboria aeruginascens]|nr:hypothetical protein B7494_g4363 [Chlorociboria aeruginascens]
MPESSPKIIQWLLDTRCLWPVPETANSREQVQGLRMIALRELSFLTKAEQDSVLKYYFLKDAKMSLASQLLKHAVITRYCGVPWGKSRVERGENGKPVFNDGRDRKIDFNVSHQAGIVSLLAAVWDVDRNGDGKVQVGTDIVCANERLEHDYKHVDKNGFFDWVDMHADVFAPSEVHHMKLSPLSLIPDSDFGLALAAKEGEQIWGYAKDKISRCQSRAQKIEVQIRGPDGNRTAEIQSDKVVDGKLRRFYTMWCLRETYVKMTGEALMASWLKDLEIRDVRAPSASTQIVREDSLEKGEVIRNFDIKLKGKKVSNVKMELSALGQDFMVAGAVRSEVGEAEMGTWLELDLEKDILAFGELMD